MTAAIVNPPSQRSDWPWDDRQIARFRFRVALFTRRGMTEPDAETWADRLAERDYERDPRRICRECRHLARDGTCFAARNGDLRGAPKRFYPLIDQLQTCEAFAWVTP